MRAYKILLIITFLVVVVFKIKGRKNLPLFFPFILIVILFEIFGEYCYYKLYGDNILILNFYSRLCIYYYLFIYWNYLKEKSWSKQLKYIIILYSIISFLTFFYVLPEINADIVNYNLGMAIVLPLILMYLYDIIYNRSHFNIFKDPYFYFSFGILLFYTSAFPLLGFINILIRNNAYSTSYLVLLNLGNIFLSLAYLGAALCSITPIQSTK